MKYKQLLNEERFLIDQLFNVEKRSITEISNLLKRNKSTISRELKRNTFDGSYNFFKAQQKATQRSWHNHSMYLLKYEKFLNKFKTVYNKRTCGIKATCQIIKSKISWRQVFNWIKSNRWVIKRSDRLRRYYKKGGKRTSGVFAKFKNKYLIPIWARPKNIDLREDFGHWEADLIVGKKSHGFENILTLIERKTRFVLMTKVKSKNGFIINGAFSQLIKKYHLKVKSITIDNGIEFAKIGILGAQIGCKIYLCDPYASYQRGSNEHVNGIIRRFWKKGTDFSVLKPAEINSVQNLINKMPRELFNWKSSLDQYSFENK